MNKTYNNLSIIQKHWFEWTVQPMKFHYFSSCSWLLHKYLNHFIEIVLSYYKSHFKAICIYEQKDLSKRQKRIRTECSSMEAQKAKLSIRSKTRNIDSLQKLQWTLHDKIPSYFNIPLQQKPIKCDTIEVVV